MLLRTHVDHCLWTNTCPFEHPVQSYKDLLPRINAFPCLGSELRHLDTLAYLIESQ